MTQNVLRYAMAHSLDCNFPITSSLAIGMESFIKGVPLLSPKVYRLGKIRTPPPLFYADAKWIVLEKQPWLSKGLAARCGKFEVVYGQQQSTVPIPTKKVARRGQNVPFYINVTC